MDSHEVYLTALEWIAKRHWQKSDKPALDQVGCFILKLALAHPQELSNWFQAHCHYRDAEDMTDESLMIARIAERKEYKLRKVKGAK